MSTLYLIRVMRVLKRQLSQSERDIVLQCFYAGYHVNYAVECVK